MELYDFGIHTQVLAKRNDLQRDSLQVLQKGPHAVEVLQKGFRAVDVLQKGFSCSVSLAEGLPCLFYLTICSGCASQVWFEMPGRGGFAGS